MIYKVGLLPGRRRRGFAREVSLGFFGLLFGFLAGCGGLVSSEATVYPVTGKVLLADGKPLTTGRVEFIPVKGGMPASGDVGADGSFSLKTGSGQQGSSGRRLQGPARADDAAPRRRPARRLAFPFPGKYADEDANTGLTATVKAEPTTLEPFKLSR